MLVGRRAEELVEPGQPGSSNASVREYCTILIDAALDYIEDEPETTLKETGFSPFLKSIGTPALRSGRPVRIDQQGPL